MGNQVLSQSLDKTYASSYFHNSDIVQSVQPGAIQLSNYNTKYSPTNRGTWKKTAPFLPNQSASHSNKKTLVLDLDETLVHASFTPVAGADVVIPVRKETIYVVFRPGAQDFLDTMGQFYEVVIFTASVESYALPLIRKLDKNKVWSGLLWREYCTYQDGMYIKDMSKLGRRLEDVILLDNSPNWYMFQKENGLPILSWYDNPTDRELLNYTEMFRVISKVLDVRKFIPKMVKGEQIDYRGIQTVIQEIMTEQRNNQGIVKYQSEKQINHYGYEKSPVRKQNSAPLTNNSEFYDIPKNDWRTQTPSTQKSTIHVSKTPLLPINSYFDNLKNTREKIASRVSIDQSHNRLSDAAYNRKSSKKSKRKPSRNSISPKSARKAQHRPGTQQNTLRASSCHPDYKTASYRTIDPEQSPIEEKYSAIRNRDTQKAKEYSNFQVSPNKTTADFMNHNYSNRLTNDTSPSQIFKSLDYSNASPPYQKQMNYNNIWGAATRSDEIQKKVESFLNRDYNTKIIGSTQQANFNARPENFRKYNGSKRDEADDRQSRFMNVDSRSSYLNYNKPNTAVGSSKTAMIRAHYGNYMDCRR